VVALSTGEDASSHTSYAPCGTTISIVDVKVLGYMAEPAMVFRSIVDKDLQTKIATAVVENNQRMCGDVVYEPLPMTATGVDYQGCPGVCL